MLDEAQAARRAGSRTSSRSCRPSRASSSTTRARSTSRSCWTTRTRSPDSCSLYIGGFSAAAQGRDRQVRLRRSRSTGCARANLLYQVVGKFAEIDLHPEAVSNIEMGYLYEELIRRFSELSNETAGEHFTPREVIRLMVNLLFIDDDDVLTKPGHRQDALRPGLRHGRDAVGRRGPPARAEPAGAAGGLRPGAERRDLRDLPLGHDAQGPGRLAHRLRQLVLRGPPRGRALRLPAREPAVRRRVEEGRGRGPQRGTRPRASTAASAPGCRASTTARSSSCST